MSTAKYAATLYELAADVDGKRVLIAYCRIKSRRSIYTALQKRADAVERVLGGLDLEWAVSAANGAFVHHCRIFWTGRTQRECEGRALPYVEDLP